MKSESTVKVIGRNCFGRYDIVRKREHADSDGCAWCGQKRRLYRYGHWSDGGRTRWFSGAFCSYDCCKAYHG